ITEKALAVGDIEPRLKFQVKSKIPGIVKRCYVQMGDKVKAGDPLFEIAPDPTPMDITNVDHTLAQAKATFDKADADYKRYQDLFKAGIVSKEDLDAKRESYQLAKVALEKAIDTRELTLKGRISGKGVAMESVIRAPAEGTILTRAVNPGDPVVPLTSYQPGTEMATIADMNDLIFRGTVDEIDVGKLKVGMPVRIKIGALPNTIVHGKLSRIAPQSEQKNGGTVFQVEIELNPHDKAELRSGYSANADIIIQEKKNVLMIPERVVYFKNGGKETYVELPGATKDAKPKKVDVKLGLSDGLNVQVLSGLKAGQHILEKKPKEI
ncbi:MAG: efflux RND transporter periplasmic adaptor subunit, partial [Acidobacteriota bacterium]